MSFLKTIAEAEASGEVAVNYQKDIERVGYLPNYSRTFSLHPAAYQAWRGLIASIAKPMDPRRGMRLATIGGGQPTSIHLLLAGAW